MEARHFKILCIDGGGIKGIYSAELLAKFEEVFGCVVSDCFDMLCGTSTGGNYSPCSIAQNSYEQCCKIL